MGIDRIWDKASAGQIIAQIKNAPFAIVTEEKKRSKQSANIAKQNEYTDNNLAKFKCDVCSKPFMRKIWLVKHKSAVHGHETAPDLIEVEQQTDDDSLGQTISRVVSTFEPSPDTDPGNSTAEPHSLDFDFLTDVDNNVIGMDDSGYVEPQTEASQTLVVKASHVLKEAALKKLPASRRTKPRPNLNALPFSATFVIATWRVN